MGMFLWNILLLLLCFTFGHKNPKKVCVAVLKIFRDNSKVQKPEMNKDLHHDKNKNTPLILTEVQFVFFMCRGECIKLVLVALTTESVINGTRARLHR